MRTAERHLQLLNDLSKLTEVVMDDVSSLGVETNAVTTIPTRLPKHADLALRDPQDFEML